MESVAALQAGLDYQAIFFWYQATKLAIEHTNVEQVEWESSASATGFDDVVVRYNPGTLSGSRLIRQDCFQVKFHVDHKKQFTYEALRDPAFIGTKTTSILNRLHAAYQKDNQVADYTRLYLINSWGLDSNNPIGALLDNEGAIRLNVLFDGKSDETKFGKIRKSWREHLGVNDNVLRQVLIPLRIKHSYASFEELNETLNMSLKMVRLKPLEVDKRIHHYVDLIRRLHAAQQTTFTRELLWKVCETEGLTLPTGDKGDGGIHKMGVRSFQRGAETLHLEVSEILCLLGKFSGRFLLEEESWKEVAALIGPFAQQAISAQKPIELYLDTHLSLAFAMGYHMDSKTGITVSVIQKIMGKKLTWLPDPKVLASHPADLWNWEREELTANGKDLVISISATHDIKAQVQTYANNELRDAAAIIHATIAPHPSNTAFRDADHIVASIYELVSEIRKSQAKVNGIGTVHILMAAPNAFAFYLGQHAKPLGKIALYEYDFERQKNGSYQLAITLPL